MRNKSAILTRNAHVAHRHGLLPTGTSARSFDAPVVAFRRVELIANLYPLTPDRSDLYACLAGFGMLLVATIFSVTLICF